MPQVNRRTLQYKHQRIANLLAQNDRQDTSKIKPQHLTFTMQSITESVGNLASDVWQNLTRAVNDCCRAELTLEERDHVIADIVREITALWQTDELRRRKPTPVDGEPRWCHTGTLTSTAQASTCWGR